MNTDARRKASAAYHAKRAAEGLKKVTLWLSPEARGALDALKATHGSKDAAATAAICALASPLGDAIERVALALEPGLLSPASGPVAWTPEKVAAMKDQARNLAKAAIDAIR